MSAAKCDMSSWHFEFLLDQDRPAAAAIPGIQFLDGFGRGPRACKEVQDATRWARTACIDKIAYQRERPRRLEHLVAEDVLDLARRPIRQVLDAIAGPSRSARRLLASPFFLNRPSTL
jgi:hypothetical protein